MYLSKVPNVHIEARAPLLRETKGQARIILSGGQFNRNLSQLSKIAHQGPLCFNISGSDIALQHALPRSHGHCLASDAEATHIEAIALPK